MNAPEIDGLSGLEPISAHAFRAKERDGRAVVARVVSDRRLRVWGDEEPGGRWVPLESGGAIVRPWFEHPAELVGMDASDLVSALLPVIDRVASLHANSVAHGRIDASHIYSEGGELRLVEPAGGEATVEADMDAIRSLLHAGALDADRTVVRSAETLQGNVSRLLESFDGGARSLASQLRELFEEDHRTQVGMKTVPPVARSGSIPAPVPDRIAGFELRGLLGKGGMGFVYEAYDAHLQRELAIKTVRLEILGEEGKQRFLREARACSKINHPNIVTVYAAGEVDGDPYMAMELVRGRTLRAVLDEDPPSWQTLVQWIASLLDALERLHGNGIVHRDLKPENIMITHEGVPKLMDFGLAHMAAGAQLTETGVLMGTLHYMSPEQVLGKEIDARSDVFSMGVLLYQALSGDLPFTGEHPMSILYAIQNTPTPAIDSGSRQFPPELYAVVKHALAKRREERFASAGPFRDALLEVLDADRPAPGRSRAWIVGVAAVAVLAVLGLALFRVMTGPDREAAIQHNELAQELQAADDLAAARLEYRRALVADPGFEVAWNNLGLLSWTEGAFAEADSFFRRASDLDPDYATPRFNRARMLEDQKRWPQAESAYRVALTADPDFLPAYNNLAVLLLVAGRFQEALDFAEEGVEKSTPDDVVRPFLLRTLGRCLRASGDSAAAVQRWEEALTLSSDDSALLEYLAETTGRPDFWSRLRRVGDDRQRARADSALANP